MRNLCFISIFCITLVLCSCGDKPAATKYYINVDSIVTRQVAGLIVRKAEVEKISVLNLRKDSARFVPDSLTWEKEFDVFRELDAINKPIYKDAYAVTDGDDVNSNLIIRSFEATRDLPVKSIRLFYYENVDDLRKIEAVFSEKNSLYSNKRWLAMTFDNMNGQKLLTHYSIEGVQKMIMSDSVRFTIQSKIIF